MDVDLAAGLAAPALFVAAGAGLQALLPRPLERALPARLGLAYLTGAAWCAVTVWAASLLAGAGVGRASFLCAGGVAVAAGVAAVVRRQGGLGGWQSAASDGALRGRWAARLLAIGSIFVAVSLLADAVVHPVSDFDGRMTWGTVARYLQAERTVLPNVLLDPAAYVIHPRYPLTLPLLQVAAAELAGEAIESRAVRPLYALFWPALLLALWPLVARAGGRRAGALAMATFCWVPLLLSNQEIGPLGTYSDLPLAGFLAGALALLLHPAARSEPWRGWLAGLLLAAAAGTKNEGLLLAPALLLAVTFACRWRLQAPGLVRAAGVLSAGVALVLAWRVRIPNRNDELYFESLSASAIASGLAERLPEIVERVAARLFDVGAWGLIWIAPWVWVVGVRGARSRPARVAALLLAAQATLVVAAYAVTPDLAIVGVTWDRFVVQMLAPLALLSAATARAALLTARQRSAV